MAVGAAAEGRWRVVSLEVDGAAVEIGEQLLMDVTAEGFRAETTCNWQIGEFGGDIRSTAMLCDDQTATTVQMYMRQAFDDMPTERNGQLAFESGDVRLVYERFDPPPTSDPGTGTGRETTAPAATSAVQPTGNSAGG